jgi:hypothetical protein
MGLDARGFTLRYARIVRPDGFVEVHGLRYFVGFEHIGRQLTVRVGRDVVEVHVADGVTVEHPRHPVNGKYSIHAAQREEVLVKDGARPLVKRQLLMDLCPAAEWFFTELRHRRPDRWEDEVALVFGLLEEHGEARVRDALIVAGRRGLVGADYLAAILTGQAAEEVSR